MIKLELTYRVVFYFKDRICVVGYLKCEIAKTSFGSLLNKHLNHKVEHITGFVTRLTRRVPLVEEERLTFPEHMSLPPVFCGMLLDL